MRTTLLAVTLSLLSGCVTPAPPPRPTSVRYDVAAPTSAPAVRVPIDAAKLADACRPFLIEDSTAFPEFVRGRTVAGCDLERAGRKRPTYDAELFRVVRLDVDLNAARFVVRDLLGEEWLAPCECLALNKGGG